MFGYSLIKDSELASCKAEVDKLKAELQAIKAKEDSEIPLKFIYEDTLGNKYYEYENFTTLPALRSIAVEVAIKQLALCLTLDEQKTLFDNIAELINTEKFAEAIHIIMDMKYRVEYVATEPTLLELATVYFVIDGENPKAYEEKWKRKKLKAWQVDPEAKAFFLSRAWQNIKSYSDISVDDIASYLAKNQKAQGQIWEQIQSWNSPDTSTESTNSTIEFVTEESAT